MEIDKLTELPKAELFASFEQGDRDIAASRFYSTDTPEETAAFFAMVDAGTRDLVAKTKRDRSR